jgi:hypothetical protein
MSMRSLVRRVVAFLVGSGLGILALAADATGCPVCFAADERTRATFVSTAVLLSLLPFVLFAAIALWLHRELRTHHETSQEPGQAAHRGPGTK